MQLVVTAIAAFAAGYAAAMFTPTSAVPVSAPVSAERAVTPAAQQPAEDVFRATLALPMNGRGHAVAEAEIDGARMDVLVDTGASTIALRESDARAAGYRLRRDDFTIPVNTANGTAYFAEITLRSVELGPIRVRNVRALVGPDEALGSNLLGMTFLGALDSVRIEDDRIVLEN